MCLGVPGRVVRAWTDPSGIRMGQVSFGGIRKEVCLAYAPEADEGDYVIVHVGFAISRVDEAEAHEIWRLLERLEELDELRHPQPGDPV
jgi:hydrogenase expression/formation protein HypC